MAKRKMIGTLFFALIAEMDLVIKNISHSISRRIAYTFSAKRSLRSAIPNSFDFS